LIAIAGFGRQVDQDLSGVVGGEGTERLAVDKFGPGFGTSVTAGDQHGTIAPWWANPAAPLGERAVIAHNGRLVGVVND
jgi:hypothetical protein